MSANKSLRAAHVFGVASISIEHEGVTQAVFNIHDSGKLRAFIAELRKIANLMDQFNYEDDEEDEE